MVRTRPAKKWRAKSAPLLRGDNAGGLTQPVPASARSIVRHVLFLGGPGRPTPYHSTTETEAVALRWAGPSGRIYQTTVKEAQVRNVRHVSHLELLQLLRGNGHGDAAWPSAADVKQARRYVEQSAEHLLDFSGLAGLTADQLAELVDGLYGVTE